LKKLMAKKPLPPVSKATVATTNTPPTSSVNPDEVKK